MFLVGTAIAITANAVAIIARLNSNLLLCLISAALIAMSGSIVAQMRFIVIEYVKVEHIPSALSIIMLGGIIAAFLGPELGSITAHWFSTVYVGSFIGISILQVISALFIFLIKENKKTELETTETVNRIIAPKGWKLMAISSSVFAYAVMSCVMTATLIKACMSTMALTLQAQKTSYNGILLLGFFQLYLWENLLNILKSLKYCWRSNVLCTHLYINN